MNTIQMENKYQLPTYQKIPLIINKGKGAYVFDEKGNKYLDFYGGHAVALVGHSHPKVVKAVTKQISKLIFYSNVVYNDQRAKAAKTLVNLAPKPFSSVFFCNSGTEANETALKLAKKFTGKDEVISFDGSFHGRTVGALSITGSSKYKKHVGSLINSVKFANFGDIKSVEQLITSNTAAIILEAIQSIAGVNVADASFYKGLKKLAKAQRIVLIYDEVQSGLGRCGKMFFGELVDSMPDIITLAKGIAWGLPAGAVLVSEKIAKSVENGDQGCTFGGGPVICSAILATLDVIKKEKFCEKVAKYGKNLKAKISQFPHVIGVYGEGLLLGIKYDIPAKDIQTKLLDKFIITGTSDNPNVLRIMPPLTITEKEITIFLDKLNQVFKDQL